MLKMGLFFVNSCQFCSGADAFYGKRSEEQSFVLNPPGRTRLRLQTSESGPTRPSDQPSPVGLLSAPLLCDARRRPAPSYASTAPPPPSFPARALENNAKVGLNGRLFSHELLGELHIKVVLQSRNTFSGFFCNALFSSQMHRY